MYRKMKRDLPIKTDATKLFKNHKEVKEEEKTTLLLPTKNERRVRTTSETRTAKINGRNRNIRIKE